MFYSPEKYLTCVKNPWSRKCLALLRCSCHPLNIEKGRHKQIPRNDRLCQLCLKKNINIIEDEYHFISICDCYSDLRKQYLPTYDICSYNEFNYLMMTENETELIDLATFVVKAFKLREILLQEVTV